MELSYIMKFFFVFVGAIYLKSSFIKIKKSLLFYMAIKEYKIFRNELLVILLVSLLITAELFIAVSFITGIASQLFKLIVIIIHVFYLRAILKNMNKSHEDNCGCFSIQIPKRATIRNVQQNICIIILMVIAFGIQNRIMF